MTCDVWYACAALPGSFLNTVSRAASLSRIPPISIRAMRKRKENIEEGRKIGGIEWVGQLSGGGHSTA